MSAGAEEEARILETGETTRIGDAADRVYDIKAETGEGTHQNDILT